MARQIYLIKNRENENEGYVGQGVNDVQERWDQHFQAMDKTKKKKGKDGKWRDPHDGAAELMRSVGVNGIEFSYVEEPLYGLNEKFFSSFLEYWRPDDGVDESAARLDLAEIYYIYAGGGARQPGYASRNTETGGQHKYIFRTEKISSKIKKFVQNLGLKGSIEDIKEVEIVWVPKFAVGDYQFQIDRLLFPQQQWIRKVVGDYLLESINQKILYSTPQFILEVLKNDDSWVKHIQAGKNPQELTQVALKKSLKPTIEKKVKKSINQIKKAWTPFQASKNVVLDLKINSTKLVTEIIKNLEDPISEIFNTQYDIILQKVQELYPNLTIKRGSSTTKTKVNKIPLKVAIYNCVEITYEKYPFWVDYMQKGKNKKQVFASFKQDGVQNMLFNSGYKRFSDLCKKYRKIKTVENDEVPKFNTEAMRNELKKYYDGSLSDKAMDAWMGYVFHETNGPYEYKDKKKIRVLEYRVVKNKQDLFDTMKGRW